MLKNILMVHEDEGFPPNTKVEGTLAEFSSIVLAESNRIAKENPDACDRAGIVV